MSQNKNYTKKLSLRLEKARMDDFDAKVGFNADVSGSMDDHYQDGTMQKLNEILLEVALRFDDNNEMDMHAFNSRSISIPNMNENNVETYIRDNLSRHVGGTTYCAESIRYFVDEWFSEYTKKPSFFGGMFGQKESVHTSKKDQFPGFLIVQTDGNFHDEDEVTKVIAEINEKYNMFVTFVGIGISGGYITNLAARYNNVQAVIIEDFDHIDEDVLYDSLITDKVHDFFFPESN